MHGETKMRTGGEWRTSCETFSSWLEATSLSQIARSRSLLALLQHGSQFRNDLQEDV